MPDLVKLALHGDVAVITIDNPPVNAFGPGVGEGLQESIQNANLMPEARAIVLLGAGQTFMAGADIREFGKIVSGKQPRLDLLPYLRSIEDSEKPVVVAIHGSALGAGLETAMCGHYRVIAVDAQVGQPEVRLGLIPGAGGTQRLPRLVGVPKALEMCAGGEPVKAAEAVALGLADGLIEGDLLGATIDFARQVADRPALKTRQRDEKLDGGAPAGIFAIAREQARKKGRGL